ncbi:FAD-dependent oxidoreductase [Streptomyces humidus]|uniref:FAD-dependent oxidoreductase n=1 Tax=Streptomyces humidus TaxID=52259 RepID=A0A918FZU8_9ACTN|nr:FAD-dependent oxidoreductase [Streptomyces humidus]GGS05694.1 FAD-dependent oxidoreductase [Streptomyces humidus]
MGTDVVVVGAGPVGLMTACELALTGARVTVLERGTAPADDSRAQVLHGRTIPTLDRRGLLDRFLAAERELNGGAGLSHDKRALPRGHFAGITGLDFPAPGDGLPGALFVPQAVTARILGERAAELGVRVRRGAEVAGVDQDAEGVTVRMSDGSRARGAFVVGCDGARSVVRRTAGIGFRGTDAIASTTAGEVFLGDPANAPAGWHRTRRGCTVISVHPGEGRSRVVAIEFTGPPGDRDTPVTLEELTATVARIHGRDVPMSGLAAGARYGDAALLADVYRRGRVLLAGDAAHIHYPVGGQGLNIGLQDAVNLGWKLAARVTGRACDALLDTYESERRPVADAVLTHARAQLALLAPEPRVDALRAMFHDLIGFGEVNRYLAEKISAADVRYATGAADPHPSAGGWAPEAVLTVGDKKRRLAELLHPGRPVLLCLDGGATGGALPGGRCDVVTATCPELAGLTHLLIRPDGYVAWAAAVGHSAERTRSERDAALARLAGA